MKNEKFTIPKSVTTIFMALLIVLSCAACAKTASNVSTTIAQPDYVEKVLNKNKVTELNIEIKQADWEWLLENATRKESRSCNITINGRTFYNVGIRPKGNSSLTTIASGKNNDRFSFRLDFGEYVKGQTCFGLRKMSLNNIFSDKTYMKEYLSYDLFDYIGVASPAYAYTDMTLNGKDWGLYLAVEGMEESFVERQFGSVEGNLYKPESMDMLGGNGMKNVNIKQGNGQFPGGGVKNFNRQQGKGQLPDAANRGPNAQNNVDGIPQGGNDQNAPPTQQDNMPNIVGQRGNNQQQGGKQIPGGMGGGKGTDLKYTGDSISNYANIRDNAVFKTTTDSDFKKVIEMIKNLNNGTNLEKYLDTDEILRYFAVNTFLVNLDSYAGGMYHNYYLYEKDSVCRILPWDLNMSFAGFSMNDAAKAINFPIDKPVTGDLADFPLIGKLLEVPEYKELYHKYLDEIVQKYINGGVYESSIAGISKLIDSYVKKDATKFCTYEEYKNSIPVMLAFGKERAASITAQLKGEQSSTDYGTLTTSVDLSALGSMGGKGLADKGDQGAMPAIGKGDGFPAMGGMPGAVKGGDFAAVGNGTDTGNTAEMPNTISFRQAGIIILSVILLLAGILFVFKSKRRRFGAA